VAEVECRDARLVTASMRVRHADRDTKKVRTAGPARLRGSLRLPDRLKEKSDWVIDERELCDDEEESLGVLDAG
jgi:hypothetical protein